MTNHFHLLVRVPDREKFPKLTVEGLLAMLPLLSAIGAMWCDA